jgi:hypothetical protein
MLIDSELIGEWMASAYAIGGKRWDYALSLRADGTYQRTTEQQPGVSLIERGRWEHHRPDKVLRLIPDVGETNEKDSLWWILDLLGWEGVNTILILREVMLASRNLPILFYRVHQA